MPIYHKSSANHRTPERGYTMCLRAGTVSLQQRGPDDFIVRYGMQVTDGLGYAHAAKELGQCLMHQAACGGKLDNAGG